MIEDLPPEVDLVLENSDGTRTTISVKDRDPRVRQMVQDLLDLKMTPQEISEAMDGRVSPRTIYRWGKSESYPQNEKDLRVLIDIHSRFTSPEQTTELRQ